MSPALLDALLVAASVALYAAAYAVVLAATRPARVSPAPATPDLGDEPPAVACLLANRWRLNEDASESTLLDLAARGHLELRQPGNDPRHTTIHVREREQAETLRPYEQRVRDRVTALAVDGVVPVTALTFRDRRRARRWNRALHHEVVADARGRGLSRRRMSPVAASALVTVAGVSAFGVALAVFRLALRDDDTDMSAAFWIGAFMFGVLSTLATRPLGERDTPAGREAAARWLGVQAWLRGHEEFADLPPAAVAVWDRYLPYGAALGVTRTASQVLDLGLGNRRLVWSSYGGAWRRVRVRYPRLWARYGAPVPALLLRAGLALVAGAVLVSWWGLPEPALPAVPQDPAGAFEAAGWGLTVLAVVLLLYGGYVLSRTLLDLAMTRSITGEVLWVDRWRSRSRGKDRGRVTWLNYLAIDDGTADQATAWGLPVGTAPHVTARDVVTVRVRPWTRRVVDLTVVEGGRTHLLDEEAEAKDPSSADTAADAPTDGPADTAADGAADGLAGVAGLRPSHLVATLVNAVASTVGATGSLAPHLLTAGEVSEALGVAVGEPRRVPVPGPLATATFHTSDRGRQVLQAWVASGPTGQRLIRRVAGGTALPGIGDGAYLAGHQGAVRVGDLAVLLALNGPGRSRSDRLPWLLERAAARIPRQREPA